MHRLAAIRLSSRAPHATVMTRVDPSFVRPAEGTKGSPDAAPLSSRVRRDPEVRWEDMIVELVAGGAVAVECEAGKLPMPGDDAATRVSSAYDTAYAEGKTARKEQAAKRKEKKKLKFDAIMEGKMNEHISNASACSIVVADTADTEGYKYGSRG